MVAVPIKSIPLSLSYATNGPLGSVEKVIIASGSSVVNLTFNVPLNLVEVGLNVITGATLSNINVSETSSDTLP